MAVETRIQGIDPDAGAALTEAAVLKQADRPSGAHTYITPYKDPPFTSRPLISTVGAEMNVEVGFAGTPDHVHDGIDSTLWTGSAITGSWTFDDSAHAYQSIITIVDYTALSGASMTINEGSGNQVATEPGDWSAATSNTATATSLAAHIDTFTGVSATSSGAVVTVTVANSGDITTFTSSDGTNMPATAQSVDGSSAGKNSEAQLERGSTLDTSTYSAVHGKIFLTAWSATGTKDIELRFRNGGVDQGNPVGLESIIDNTLFNQWQTFLIPVSEFGNPGVVDQLMFLVTTTSGPAPDFWLDYIRIEETGGFLDFEYAPNKDEKFVIHKIATTAVVSGVTAAAVDYDKFFGITELTNGLSLRKISNGVVFAGIPVCNLFDYMQFGQLDPVESIPGLTHTTTKTVTSFIEPLDGRLDEKFVARVQDDLTGLTKFKYWLTGTIEKVKPEVE